MMTYQSKLISRSDPEAKPWLAFFSTLWDAELAAAQHCLWLSDQFKALGNPELALKYGEMAQEEFGHAELVESVCSEKMPATIVMQELYEGKRLRCDGISRIAEVMSLIHLCFEPSAMAFLSFFHKEAKNLFVPEWAAQMESSFGTILKEEASHVRSGKNTVKRFLAQFQSNISVEEIRLSLKSGRSFIIGGVKRCFQGYGHDLLFSQTLINRYKFSHNNAIAGVFDAAS